MFYGKFSRLYVFLVFSTRSLHPLVSCCHLPWPLVAHPDEGGTTGVLSWGTRFTLKTWLIVGKEHFVYSLKFTLCRLICPSCLELTVCTGWKRAACSTVGWFMVITLGLSCWKKETCFQEVYGCSFGERLYLGLGGKWITKRVSSLSMADSSHFCIPGKKLQKQKHIFLFFIFVSLTGEQREKTQW